MKNEMPIYVLQRKGEKQVQPAHSASGVERRVWANVNGWYDARAEALQDAISRGARTVGIISSDVMLYRRPHGHEMARAGVNECHGMWLYLERLCARYGHVYVPPTKWAPQHPSHGEFLCPVIPLVSAYQVKALQALDSLDGAIGWKLCGAGYDSYTVGDYFHQNVSYRPDEDILDEYGTTASWHRAYLRSIEKELA
jgi:hypothetical protein